MVYKVIQVQDAFTGVAATKRPEGVADAKEKADKVISGLGKYKKLYKLRNDKDSLKTVKDVKKSFQSFYGLGKQMAEAYSSGNLDAESRLMNDFDKAAVSVTGKIEKFSNKESKEAEAVSEEMGAAMSKSAMLS